MPETWKSLSRRYIGYVAGPTLVNQNYVAVSAASDMKARGMSDHSIALTWNQGNDGPCGSGTNRYGVRYDSCGYVATVLQNIKTNN